MSNESEGRLQLEIIKLLIQVAWADHEITDEEAAHVCAAAREAELGDDAVAMLTKSLRGEIQLPPPDLGFLKAHRQATLDAAAKLVQSDNAMGDDEFEVFEQIRELLSDD